MKNYKKCSADYKTSANCKRLIKLLKAGKQVVCFVTYNIFAGRNEKPLFRTDVCIAEYHSDNDSDYRVFEVSCLGTGFFSSSNYMLSRSNFRSLDELFIDQCKTNKLKYIEPTL